MSLVDGDEVVEFQWDTPGQIRTRGEKRSDTTHPNSGLEANREGTLVDEQHSRSGGTSSCGNGSRELDLIDKSCLNSHHGGHDKDHRKQQRLSADSVNQEPRDE